MTWVLAGMKPLTSVGGEAVKLKIINHDALNNLRTGNGTKLDFDTLVEALNITEALAIHRIGADWRTEIRSAQDAVYALGRRAVTNGMRFVFKAEELNAVNLAMEVHDAQLDACTVNDLEAAIKYVNEIIRTKRARSIVTKEAT